MSITQDKKHRQHVNFLLAEVALVEKGCEGTRIEKPIFQLDDFQRDKIEFNNLLQAAKENIQIRDGIRGRVGQNTEEIRLKYEIENDITRAKTLYGQMTESYNKDLEKSQQKKGDALNQPELEERGEILRLFQQDLDYTENLFKPKSSGLLEYRTARDRVERRRKLREEGKMSSEAIPLSEPQRAFIQESIERDGRLDEKLDMVTYEVRKLREIAFDINHELEKQQETLTVVDERMTTIQTTLETRNRQIKKLLEKSGGATRWCVALILFVILFALCGYIYNSV